MTTTTTEPARVYFDRDLPVQLTDDENQRYGKQLADKIKEMQLAEERKKQQVALLTAGIKAIDQEIKRIADARAKGAELRPVKCYEQFDAGAVLTIRSDTGEAFESRPADFRDRQTTIPEYDQPPVEEPAEGEVGPVGEGSMVTSSVGAQVYSGETPPDDGETAGEHLPGDDDDGESPPDDGETDPDVDDAIVGALSGEEGEQSNVIPFDRASTTKATSARKTGTKATGTTKAAASKPAKNPAAKNPKKKR